MEAFWILLAVGVVVGPWILAIAGFVRGGRLMKRMEILEARLALFQARPRASETVRPSTTAPEDAYAQDERDGAPAGSAPGPGPQAIPGTGALGTRFGAEAVPGASVRGEPSEAEPRVVEPRTVTEPVLSTTLAPGTVRPSTGSGRTEVPPPAPPSPPGSRPSSPAAAPAGTLEERIALVWLTRVGALIVLLGAATFFKWAVDNDWIGPAGRVGLGVLAGAGAIAAGEALRARTRALWVNVLQGAGVALLFFSIFAAATLYQLVPYPAAFAAIAVVAAAGGGLALRGRSEVVLALSLAGGLLAPVLLSTGEDHPAALLAWLLVVSGAALAVSARLGFRIVPWLAMAGSAVLFAGWYDRYFQIQPPPALLDPDLPAEAQQGAYFSLPARALPLLLALAHVGAWLLAWARARPRGPFGTRAVTPARSPGVGEGGPSIPAGELRWPRPLADAWLAVSLAGLHAVVFAFLRDRPLAAGAALALAGLAAALLAARADRPVLHPLAGALGGLLLAAALRHGAASIAAAALWAAVHLAAAGRTLLAPPARPEEADAPPPAPAVLAAALAGLGFAGLALVATRDDQGLLRAALVGAAAAAELGVGAVMLRKAPLSPASGAGGAGGPDPARARATVLLGSALGLVAAALAFLLSGASMTVAWAALGAAVAVVAARERDRLWLAGALAVLALALGHALASDLRAPEAARLAFLFGAGAQGALQPTLLLNARAAGLLAVAVALLVAARAVVRVEGWRVAAGALATLAHGALLVLAVAEARDAVLSLPAPPPVGDALSFEEFRNLVFEAMRLQAGALDTTTTVVMGLYAVVLVGVGFLAREVLHRWLGLALFAATLAKVMLSDVWRLGRGQQILVFLAVGMLMLAAGFLYARYGRRILGLLGTPPPGGAGGSSGAVVVLLAAGLSLAPGRALALDPAPFQAVRPIEGIGEPGLHAVRVDASLWQASLGATGTLADLRIAGPGGEEIRWALRRVAGQEADQEVQSTLVDPVLLPGGALRAVVDKGRRGLRTDELRLDLTGDDFLRPVRIESSEDGRGWGVLAEGPRVYAVRAVEGARRTTVLHPPSDARFLRVTVLPGGGEIPRLSGARPYRRAAVPPPVDHLDLPAPPRVIAPDGKTSLYDLDLGAPGLPADAVVLVTDAAGFERRIRVLASADGKTWAEVGCGLAFRVPGDEELRVPLRASGRRWLRVAVTEGDAPPLAILATKVEWPAHELVLDAAAAGPHRLYAGAREVRAPAYDLAAVLDRARDARPAPARLGATTPNPAYAPVEAPLPFTERHRVALGVVLGLVLVAVGVFAFRLLRAAT